MTSAAATQLALQGATQGQGIVAATQIGAQAAFSPPSTLAVRQSKSSVQAPYLGQPIPAASQLAVQVAYKTGSVENLNLRAWTFALDGHTFYVVTLGEEGTYVYDLDTGQWAQWQTAGLSGWNMEQGIIWNNRVVAGDQSNPTIWELDPESFLDDGFKTQTRVVTGGLSTRLRNFPPVFEFRITASLAEPDVANTAPATQPTVSLRFSDDKGKTYTQAEQDIVIDTTQLRQEISWRSLGVMNSPFRVFEVTDVGAVATIYGADVDVGGEEDG